MTRLRPAEARDAAALAELAERTFRDAFASQNRAEDMDAHCRKHYGEGIQAAEIGDPDRTTLVCEQGNELVGYGQLRWGNRPSCVLAAKPAEIQRLYVSSEWHGKGVAHALMNSLLDVALARGADAAWLGVWERNARALAFYEKFGFRLVGEHAFVLGEDRQRDFILEKGLPLERGAGA